MQVNIKEDSIPAMRELIWNNPEFASKSFCSDFIVIDKELSDKIQQSGYALSYSYRVNESDISIAFADENKNLYLVDGVIL